LPGREERVVEQSFTNLMRLVKTLSIVLAPKLDKPFALYGHSMGTLLAFELARELRRQNRPGPVHIFVSGRCAPHVIDPDPPIHSLPDEEFVEGVRRYNGTSEEVLQNKQLMEMFLPLLRADFEVCETYVYRDEPPLDCPVSAYAGRHEIARDLLQDWADLTTGNFESMIFPGDHFFLNTERARFVRTISDRLKSSYLDNALSPEAEHHRASGG